MTDCPYQKIKAAWDAMAPELREPIVREIKAIKKDGVELWLAVRDMLDRRLAALDEGLVLHAQGRFPEMDGDRLWWIYGQIYDLYSALGYDTEVH